MGLTAVSVVSASNNEFTNSRFKRLRYWAGPPPKTWW